MDDKKKMATRLENRISVLVIVEGESLNKLDRLAGAGNRSAYIRYLIDTVDGTEARKYIELEAQVRVLEKLPKIQGKRIGELEVKVEQLRSVNKQLISGGSQELGDIPGVSESVAGFRTWLNTLLVRGDIGISRSLQLDRIRIKAKDLGVKPQDLLDYIHTALNIKGLDLSKIEEV
jgi:hypothetical protein